MRFAALSLPMLMACITSVTADTLNRYTVDCERVDGFKGLYTYKEIKYDAWGIGGNPPPVRWGQTKICLAKPDCQDIFGYPAFAETLNGHTFKYIPKITKADHYSLDGNERTVPTGSVKNSGTDSYCTSVCDLLSSQSGIQLKWSVCVAENFFNLENLG